MMQSFSLRKFALPSSLIFFAFALAFFPLARMLAAPALGTAMDGPAVLTLSSGWQLQDIVKVPETGDKVSLPAFAPAKWYNATVPGTVLTSLVNAGVYPEPLYGENNRPDKIPDSLCRTSYWYRTTFTVPADYTGRQIWLNFHGANYISDVWVNGKDVGQIRGAFARGIFNVTAQVTPGQTAALAVLVHPPLHPGTPQEQMVATGLGPNGGVMMQDGPTFGSSMGWDWIPAIRDRDMGLWQKVTLSATGPVVIQDPYIVSDLPLPEIDSANLTVSTTLHNVTSSPQSGTLHGSFGDTNFETPVTLQPGESKLVTLTPETTPQLHLANPKLWWPNGFGAPNLYNLRLTFDINNTPSDIRDTSFGIRKITYSVPSSSYLTLSVNGVPVFCKGGNWGMDEAMKRIPRERLETQIKLHQEANYTMIRNWVGQSTGEDFYDLCDKYGIMIWDEFFQANPSDGPVPDDVPLYLANVREKVLRFRNHPSIALWCGRNEGNPAPPALAEGNAAILAELNPDRLYQPSSTDGLGVRSGGPYSWRPPAAFYNFTSAGMRAEVFKTEIGCVSIPTLESIYGMMPAKDAESFPNDDWAEHDLARGANQGDNYVRTLTARYGPINTLPEFVRKAQLANYEAYRALYEGRFAKLFAGSTGALTWMSNPAQPSTTWQIYSYDLEPFSSFFAVRMACEPLHVQMNQNNFHLVVVNHTPVAQEGLSIRTRIFNLDGSPQADRSEAVTAKASAATDAGAVEFPPTLSPVHFVKTELRNADGLLISDNFYWRGTSENDLTALDSLPMVTLDSKIVRRDAKGQCVLEVTLTNPGKVVALMAHLQLRNQKTNQRVLPVFYSDNYVSLLPGESTTIEIEADSTLLGPDQPLVTLDGWNVTTKNQAFSSPAGPSAIAVNTPAIVTKTTAAK